MIHVEEDLAEELLAINAGLSTLERVVSERAISEYHWHLMEAARLLSNAKYILRRATAHLNDYEANPGSDDEAYR